MTPTRPTSLGKYIKRVHGLFWTHCLPIVKPKVKPPIFKTGEGRDHVLLMVSACFHDDSVLEAMEKLIEDRDGVRVVQYSYAYKRPSGFFVHYKMEQDPEQTIIGCVRKPHNHLHVGAVKEKADCLESFPPELHEHGGPHFGTPFVTLDGVLATIIVNYFYQDINILDELNLNQC